MLPKTLIESVKSKNLILFLGAGASYGAKHPKDKSIPKGQELADLIASKFLGHHYLNKPLSQVSELAINESSLFDVQSYIHELLHEFEPSDYHLRISEFPWNTIFTTNYDNIIESAYRKNKAKVQFLHPIVRNTPYSQLPKDEKALYYYKLHGCLSVINDLTLPLILTIDQFVDYENGRESLFKRLEELAYNYPIVFVGYSIADTNIRYILQKIEKLKGAKPMYYIVSPTITAEEERYWSSRRFTIFKQSFEEFLTELDKSIDKNQRILGSITPRDGYPIFNRFKVDKSEIKPTSGFIHFIENDIDYVHRDIQSNNTDPKSFYKGYFENWDPIIKNLDVKRGMSEGLLYEIFLNEIQHISSDTFLYLVQGNAGSGKSVLLKRIAFEAATEIDRTCIFLRKYSKASIDQISELYNYLKERIYLFVDNIAESKNDIIRLLQKASKLNIPLTIIGAERSNIWNTECEELSEFLSDSYTLKYLSDKEITELLILLEKHNSLGALKFKNDYERKSLFKEKAGSELLVALYEATNSKPFEEIIFDEYNSIGNPIAQSLYLTVSILHRLGAEARAGLISRVHGISFSEFREKLFKPLEYIVFDRKNPKINDYVYLTRHKQVAEFIFSLVLQSPQERFDKYVEVLTDLNLDFESDRIAYMTMTNSKHLINIFPDPRMIRQFYDHAEDLTLDRNKLLQQRAIFEMNALGGSVVVAERLLREAGKEIDDPTIEHSLAELFLKKAENARYDNEFFTNIEEVISRCNKILKGNKNSIHPYHTILKAILLKLKKIVKNSDDSTLQKTLKDAEKYFSLAKQVDAEDAFILETESTFNEIINDMPNAKQLLKSAFEKNKSSTFIVLRYANFLEREKNVDDALESVKNSIQMNPHDRDLNFKFAELLMLKPASTIEEVLHYLRRSFTQGDTRYNAQFLYARGLFINGQQDEARNYFNKLSSVRISPHIKNTPRATIQENGKDVEYYGEITSFYYSYGTITRDKFGDKIFFKTLENDESIRGLKNRQRVKFNIAFNYKGAIAININKI